MAGKYIAVIQAGGKGTRLQSLTNGRIPKPLLELNGKPMIQWQIENVVKYGIREVIIIIGHLGEKIQEYFGNGDRWKIRIEYIKEDKPLGSAGALYYLKNRKKVDFIFIFGDVMFDLDWERFIRFHEEKGGFATLLVHPNSHPYDSDLVVMDHKNKVTEFVYKGNQSEEFYDNCVNAGLYILKKDILDIIEKEEYLDLEKDVFRQLILQGLVYGYKTPEYVKDAGTPERFRAVSEEQRKGVWSRRNLKKPQKCIFLDRDGTLNRYNGFICTPDELDLEDNAAEAVRLINESGYLAIVVTNQQIGRAHV